ncbi:MAG: DUF4105 domain-containing protein [Granulosicoccus sp.]
MSALLHKLLVTAAVLLAVINNAHAKSQWLEASHSGNYDLAVELATRQTSDSSLASLLNAATLKKLAQDPQWRAFIHYKPALGGRWKSQVDAPHFFMSETGKNSPEDELNATIAAFFSNNAKAPLRLTAYCRFVARRHWISSQLGKDAALLPERECPEFDRFVDYLAADTLTLIFPTAHPNSPSSAFGHTLLRIDKKDQRPESRLLNMSINFAAEVPPDVSNTAYAVKGLAGGFAGKFRMLPYHIKLREYGQIENRDTWEYELVLDKPQVDLVLRHAYEMLISHFDYFFFSENCSYHLLSLIEVAYPHSPMTEDFGMWTIPVDTIRVLRDRELAGQGRFVPSSIRTLKARRDSIPASDSQLAYKALEGGLDSIDDQLGELNDQRQVGVLDLLSDYERYGRLKSDASAQGSSDAERAILSRRSKLGIPSDDLKVPAPASPPDAGHGTARISLNYRRANGEADLAELTLRPAYHDFRDPSAAFDTKASIELGLLGVALDLEQDRAFLNQFTLVSIESIEPRGQFFKPISWHTNLKWQRPSVDSRHVFTFNVGAGAAFQSSHTGPIFFFFGESDLLDTPAFKRRRQLRLGISAGAHWEPVRGWRTGIETDYRRHIADSYYEAIAEVWTGIALSDQISLNLDASLYKVPGVKAVHAGSIGIRTYF